MSALQHLTSSKCKHGAEYGETWHIMALMCAKTPHFLLTAGFAPAVQIPTVKRAKGVGLSIKRVSRVCISEDSLKEWLSGVPRSWPTNNCRTILLHSVDLGSWMESLRTLLVAHPFILLWDVLCSIEHCGRSLVLGLQRWLCDEEHLLLSQRAGVQSSGPTLCSCIPVPVDPPLSSGLGGHIHGAHKLTQVHINEFGDCLLVRR